MHELVERLVPLNIFANQYPIEIDLIYADENHPLNQFPGLYHADSKLLWVEKDLAIVTLLASNIANRLFGWKLRVFDSLRPIEAQEKMSYFNFPTSLVSLPGVGAHPRAMAIDLQPVNTDGTLVEMGTVFDFFATDPNNYNPAARDFVAHSHDMSNNSLIWANRYKLEFIMRQAASIIHKPIFALPQEWWDFRFYPEYTDSFAPISEDDLRPYQRLIEPDRAAIQSILSGDLPVELVSLIKQVGDELENYL